MNKPACAGWNTNAGRDGHGVASLLPGSVSWSLAGQQALERISAQMCSMDEARAFCVNSVVLCTPRAWIRMRKKHSFKMRPFRDCILLAPGGWRPGLRCRTLVTREAVGSFAFTSVLTFGPPPMSSSLHVYTSFLTIGGTSASAAAVSTSGSSSSSSLSAVGRLSEARGGKEADGWLHGAS